MTIDMSYVTGRREAARAEAARLRVESRAEHPAPSPVSAGHGHVGVEVSCPRCGAGWKKVNEDRARGPVRRERRVVIRCVRRGCGWEGAAVVELVDLGVPRDLPRGRRGAA